MWCVQTAGLIPFRSVIFHPIAYLFSLRMSSRLFSCEVLSIEDITTRHCDGSRAKEGSVNPLEVPLGPMT